MVTKNTIMLRNVTKCQKKMLRNITKCQKKKCFENVLINTMFNASINTSEKNALKKSFFTLKNCISAELITVHLFRATLQ